MAVQSVLIPRIIPLNEAIKWVKSHNFKVKKIDTTDRFYRFRQYTPKDTDNYITKVLPNGVELIIAV